MALFISLFNNLAIFIFLVIVLGGLRRVLRNSRPLARQAIMGAAFAAFVFGCMHVKIPVAPGVQVDQRNAIIILSGLFGGPLSALIAAAAGISYRAFLGGAGVFGGSFGMVLSALAGTILKRYRGKLESPWKMAVASVAAAVFVLPGFLPIGTLQEGWNLMLGMALPYGSAISVGVLFGSLLVMNEERRQDAASMLEISEKRYRELFESLIDVSFRVGPDGRFMILSPSARKVLGYGPEELVGKGVDGYLRYSDNMREIQARLVANGRIENEDAEFVRKDGSIAALSINARRVEDRTGTTLWYEGVLRDVTQAKRAAEETKRLEEALRQGQKMQAIGQLAGGVAHDFNNMLSGIIGFTEVAQSQLEPGHPAGSSLEQVLSAGERAKRLVERILTFSRGASGELMPMRIRGVVEEALKLLRMSAPASIDIEVELADESGSVLAEATQLHEAVMNIATNGLHAMKDRGGSLRVALREISIDEPMRGRIGVIRPGRYVTLEFKDSGKGMDAETMDKAFEPFFTTKPHGEGTGMGLAVVYGIMQGHGGDIALESEPGIGTAVTLYFPQRADEVEEEEKDSAPVPVGNERILLVDDEQMIVDFTARNLISFGYSVTAVSDPLRALEILEGDPAGYALLITDQTMPRMTGLELAKEALSLNPSLPVILCTGYTSALAESEALAARIRKVCMKPVKKREMAITIRRVLDGSDD